MSKFQLVIDFINRSRLIKKQKQTKWLCSQQRLKSAWASAQFDRSSLCAKWVAKDPSFLPADSEDSDQTGWMPRLIWVFAGRTCHFVGFVRRWLTCWRSSLGLTRLNSHDNDSYTLSHVMSKPAFEVMRPGKVQTRLLNFRIWLESCLLV